MPDAVGTSRSFPRISTWTIEPRCPPSGKIEDIFGSPGVSALIVWELSRTKKSKIILVIDGRAHLRKGFQSCETAKVPELTVIT
jgi:hypothetical protein